LDGHDVILICFGVVMNALLGSEAKLYVLGLRNKSVLRDFCFRRFGHGRAQLDTRLERGFQGAAHTPDRDIVEVESVRVACFQGLDKEVRLGDQGENLVDGGAHVNLRLVCCDASSNALFD
jgi:hypothetical protein